MKPRGKGDNTTEPAPASSFAAMGLFCWPCRSQNRRSFAECYRLPQVDRPERDDSRGILTGTTSADNRTPHSYRNPFRTLTDNPMSADRREPALILPARGSERSTNHTAAARYALPSRTRTPAA